MAVPKRKTSRARKRKRRSHWRASAPALTRCAHCHQPKPPHVVCSNCGYYAGREIVRPSEEEE